MPFSSAARLKAACVFGSRSVGVFPSVGYCTLTWMPSRPISRASAILVMSPRWPRFQSVIPTRTGTGLTASFVCTGAALCAWRAGRAAPPARCSPASRNRVESSTRSPASPSRSRPGPHPQVVTFRMSSQPLRYSGRLMNGAASGALVARRFL